MGRRMRRVLAFCVAAGVLVAFYSSRLLAWSKEAVPTAQNEERGRLPLSWYQNPAGERWKPRKVLIFAYARSGSSLTGDIIHHSHEVYYVYEPLHGVISKPPKEKERLNHEILQAILHCNFSLSMLSHLTINFLHRYSETQTLERCVRYQKMIPEETEVLRSCMENAEQMCRDRPLRGAKVIRLNMTEVFDLMNLNPDLAVIFLLRDPRASMWSRMNVFKAPSMKDLPSVAEFMCRRMRTDLNMSQQLFIKYPQRFRYLRYEDLVQNPARVSHNIYKFLNLNWTRDIELRIRQQISGGSHHEGSSNNNNGSGGKNVPEFVPHFQRQDMRDFNRLAYSLTRDNGSVAAARWKVDIPVSVLRIMQDSCWDVLTLVGYHIFDRLDSFREDSGVSTDVHTFRLLENLPYRSDLNF